jgi:lysophospholipase L1-like esterase
LVAILVQPCRVLAAYKWLGLVDPELTDHYREMECFYARIDAVVPPKSTVFVGDSMTQGLCVAAVTDRGVNFGIGCDTTLGVLQRIGRYHGIPQARAVVLAIGVNDLRRRSNSEIIDNYGQILAKIPSSVPVVFSAVLPIDEQSRRERWNERIHDLNAGAAQLCSSFKNCRFIDSGAKLVNASGNLDARYHIGDGVHLSADGYRVWIKDLKSALSGIEREEPK